MSTRREMLRVLLGAPFVSLLACDETPAPTVPDGPATLKRAIDLLKVATAHIVPASLAHATRR